MAAPSRIMLQGSGDPNTVETAPIGTAYWDTANSDLYINNDGATAWTLQTGGAAPGTQRIIASGSSLLTALATVIVSTFTRNANERVWFAVFGGTKSGSYMITEDRSAPGGSDVNYRLQKTTTANEGELEFQNGTQAVTVEWVVLGIVP